MTTGQITAQIAVTIATFFKYTSAQRHTQPEKIQTGKTQRFFSTRERVTKEL